MAYRGIFPDESSRKTKRLSFPTLEKLNQAIEKKREDELGRGFISEAVNRVIPATAPLE
jgi:hypothetical protein